MSLLRSMLVSMAVLLLLACTNAPPPQAPLRTPTAVRSADLVADLYLPDAPGAHPGVVVLGGSEGGLEGSGRLASALADEGFVALAVGYFGAPELPPQLVSIPLERFDAAIDWLRRQPQVAGQPIAMLGGSKGAEAALLVASARTDLAAVVAGTPTHVSWQGLDMSQWTDVPSWTRGGQPVPYVRYDVQGSPWPLVEMYARSLRNEAAAQAARIPVEQIQAPVMLISGGEDQMWPAFAMASTIAREIRTAHPDAQVEHLNYPEAGHLVLGRPFDPTDPKAQRITQLGGTIEGNLQSRVDGWPRVIAFLRTYLTPVATP